MGSFSTEIIVKNSGDISKAMDGLIKEQDIRQVTLQAVVDTGASTLIIDEGTFQKLGLRVIQETTANVANGVKQPYKKTEPVNIQWKNRITSCFAIVMPGSPRVLLGAIPLEGMDLIVNPVKMQLEGANGEEEVMLAL